MRVLLRFVRAYPWHSVGLLAALLAAGVVEGISLTALLPLLSLAVAPDADLAGMRSGSGRLVLQTLARLGIAPSLTSLVVFLSLGILLKSAISLLANRQVGYAVAQVATDLRLALLRALLGARWEFFLRQQVGKLTNAVAWEADRASQAYLQGSTMVASAIQLVVYAAVALLLSWRATLVYLGAAILVVYALQGLVRITRRAGKRQTKIRVALLSNLIESLVSVKPLKAMAREHLADTLLTDQTNALNRAVQREILSKSGLRAVQDPAFNILAVVAGYLGIAYWHFPVATVMVLVGMLAKVLGLLGKVQEKYQEVVACESAYWSLEATIAEASAAREGAPTAAAPPHLEKGIRFDHVGFAYSDTPVLRDVSLWIPAGSFTTLIGFSGTGKTTAVDLVIGLLRPQSGRIWVDDQPLEELDRRAWRSGIGYVPQENFLLHDTILRNVTLGDPALTEADAEQALRQADAWEFVAALPGGLRGTVGERGGQLSGGQRQRIMIARALVHRPRLLVLDEATSALDPGSARALAETLKSLRGTVTLLAISHQPDFVAAADRVYRMEQGRVSLVTDRAVPYDPERDAAVSG